MFLSRKMWLDLQADCAQVVLLEENDSIIFLQISENPKCWFSLQVSLENQSVFEKSKPFFGWFSKIAF